MASASLPSSKPVRVLGLASAGVVCALAAGILAITLIGRGGPPGVVLDLAAPPVGRTPSAVKSVVASESVNPGRIDKAIFAGHALVADPALMENSEMGPLPRIADDGRKPMQAYAASAPAGKLRIAIVISGLGVSAKATMAAIAGLPEGITLGFAPYSADAQKWVSQARAGGHEVLLEVPMEPFDYPDSDPGPHTLRSGVEEDSNIQRLNWALSRFTGYAGVTNLLGQRFLSDSEALSPTLTALARRGLYFYDNGAAPQSVSTDVAGRVGVAFVHASGSLDTIQSAPEIDKQLSLLEDQARAHGSAVGSGFLYPVTVQRVALWARGLAGRGFVLVPVSAIVAASK